MRKTGNPLMCPDIISPEKARKAALDFKSTTEIKGKYLVN